MVSETVSTFGDALESQGVSMTCTTSENFAERVTDAIVEPTVGVPLRLEGLSFEETPVVTDPSAREIRDATTGVTPVSLGIAVHGTLSVPSTAAGEELVSVYPERHVAVIRASDIVPDLPAAMEWMDEQFDRENQSMVFTTGPSSTGDMGAMVTGVHGPSAVHVLVVTDK